MDAAWWRWVTQSESDLLLAVDGAGRVLGASVALRRLVDVAVTNGASLSGLLHPEDRVEVEALQNRPQRARMRYADGRWVAVELRAAAIEPNLVIEVLEAEGDAVRAPDLSWENALLYAVVEHAQVGIIACDERGRVVTYNPSIRQYHREPNRGLPLEEFVKGFSFYELDGVTPMDAQQSPLARAYRGEPVREYEYKVMSRDGDMRDRIANGGRFVDAEGRVLGAVVALQDITDQRVAEKELRRQATTDALTGLGNRRTALSRLRSALAAGGELSVIYLDLDRFKLINDSLGHGAGDALLVAVSARLLDAVGSAGQVSRLGGDEFLILVQGEAPEAVAERVAASLVAPLEVEGLDLRISASMGLAVSRPGDTPESLLRDADAAMYAAKESGRAAWARFTDEMRSAATRRLEVENELRHAFDAGRLRAVYQPVVRARDRQVIGYEALMRLDDRAGRSLPPSEFIPIAEECGLITALDGWMLRRALGAARSQAEMPRIAINLSARTIHAGGLPERVLAALDATGMPPAALEVELTETALLSATARTRDELRALRDMGVRIALDDFGTGWSSLAHLREFPVTTLKIDRSFVSGYATGGPSEAIVRSLVGLGANMGIEVVAEGVETAAQADWLTELGCDLLQGYYFGRPGEMGLARP